MIIIFLMRLVWSEISFPRYLPIIFPSRSFSIGCTDSPITGFSIGMFIRSGSKARNMEGPVSIISKVHHEWTAPIALATDYCHPVEHALVNVLPNIAYAILIGSDPFSYLFW